MGAVKRPGRVVRVSGPLVEVEGLTSVAMSEVVELGTSRLSAEVVALAGARATLQVYEYTGGLRPGDGARPLGVPLSLRLGPWLLGGVFDGLLRPLMGAPTWLDPGATNRERPVTSHQFVPEVVQGSPVKPGTRIGTVPALSGLPHRVLAPPTLHGQLEWIAAEGVYPADQPIARVSGVEITLTESWPLRQPRPAGFRLAADSPLITGQRALDVLFPVARGSTASVPGGFGTGKTLVLQQVAKWCDADVIVYIGCGERGNEMADVLRDLSALVDPRTGGSLAARTVIIANTSNMPMMAREASIYTGVTVAEYYRDMGYDVVVIADSTSRWAEALREFASRTGALPAEEGYPANLSSALAAFYERAGRVTTLGGETGSVTVLGSVSPAGGDLTEPVTAHTQRFVRCVWSLDRDLAYARHYPAVSWAGSFSRDADLLGAWHAGHGDPNWSVRRAHLISLLADADRLTALADLIGVAALPGHERVALLAGRLLREAVLQQSALEPNDAYCPPSKAAALLDAVLEVIARCHDRVAAGVPPATLEEHDFTELIRAAADTPPDGVEAVRQRAHTVLTQLAALT
jgi:V/A-type H+-transporting ATPase subunit A